MLLGLFKTLRSVIHYPPPRFFAHSCTHSCSPCDISLLSVPPVECDVSTTLTEHDTLQWLFDISVSHIVQKHWAHLPVFSTSLEPPSAPRCLLPAQQHARSHQFCELESGTADALQAKGKCTYTAHKRMPAKASMRHLRYVNGKSQSQT